MDLCNFLKVLDKGLIIVCFKAAKSGWLAVLIGDGCVRCVYTYFARNGNIPKVISMVFGKEMVFLGSQSKPLPTHKKIQYFWSKNIITQARN